jgi:hypothetical protein
MRIAALGTLSLWALIGPTGCDRQLDVGARLPDAAVSADATEPRFDARPPKLEGGVSDLDTRLPTPAPSAALELSLVDESTLVGGMGCVQMMAVATHAGAKPPFVVTEQAIWSVVRGSAAWRNRPAVLCISDGLPVTVTASYQGMMGSFDFVPGRGPTRIGTTPTTWLARPGTIFRLRSTGSDGQGGRLRDVSLATRVHAVDPNVVSVMGTEARPAGEASGVLLRAVAPGRTTVWLTLGEAQAALDVRVIETLDDTIKVWWERPAQTLSVGVGSTSYRLMATFPDGVADVTGSAIWETSAGQTGARLLGDQKDFFPHQSSVACDAEGKHTIIAQLMGRTFTALLTCEVAASKDAGLEIESEPDLGPPVRVSERLHLFALMRTAAGTRGDDVTQEAIWTVEPTDMFTLSPAAPFLGNPSRYAVTAVARRAGTGRITARARGFSHTVQVEAVSP